MASRVQKIKFWDTFKNAKSVILHFFPVAEIGRYIHLLYFSYPQQIYSQFVEWGKKVLSPYSPKLSVYFLVLLLLITRKHPVYVPLYSESPLKQFKMLPPIIDTPKKKFKTLYKMVWNACYSQSVFISKVYPIQTLSKCENWTWLTCLHGQAVVECMQESWAVNQCDTASLARSHARTQHRTWPSPPPLRMMVRNQVEMVQLVTYREGALKWRFCPDPRDHCACVPNI